MKVGIVGAEAAKFTPTGEFVARTIIRALLAAPGVTAMVSGGCHLGGADIYAEEIADELGIEKIVFRPRNRSWMGGYKPRNLKIADTCDEIHNIVVARYPAAFDGMKFRGCYHCEGRIVTPHVKSGGCWTAWRTEERGKKATWHVVPNPETE